MNKMPEHIKLIYIVALKYNAPLRKMLWLGVENKYNNGNLKAAYFIQHYLIENDNK